MKLKRIEATKKMRIAFLVALFLYFLFLILGIYDGDFASYALWILLWGLSGFLFYVGAMGLKAKEFPSKDTKLPISMRQYKGGLATTLSAFVILISFLIAGYLITWKKEADREQLLKERVKSEVIIPRQERQQ